MNPTHVMDKKELEVGDRIEETILGRQHVKFHTIDRVTKTQAVTSGGKRFKRSVRDGKYVRQYDSTTKWNTTLFIISHA